MRIDYTHLTRLVQRNRRRGLSLSDALLEACHTLVAGFSYPNRAREDAMFILTRDWAWRQALVEVTKP